MVKTARYRVFDRVTGDRQTHITTSTVEHCIAAIGLNAYGHERTSHYLIILSLPVRLYASHLGGSCCVKPIAVLHFTVDSLTSHVYG